MNLIDNASQTLAELRKAAPLIHNMTNIVVANTTANALLAIGASPAMVDDHEEAPELARVSGALVVNVGTVSRSQAEAMKLAVAVAKEASVPWVLDPVAVGALSFRTQLAKELLEHKPSVIRGNASEIMALAGVAVGGKGVDSTNSSDEALASAKALAANSGAVIAISGPTDFVCDGERTVAIKNGDAMMPYVTGLGCTATALTGATLAVCKDPLLAAAYALLYLGIAGEVAAQDCSGPASLQLDIIDALYHLDETILHEKGEACFVS
ncbi:hydroxyethylthiazole kinase [Polycladidibacter hongkongensis]|uniref:hydroxyethylthiazole kinase n=1 Tax=Polycladidibacter hongkongensis TaxID=1647556 RepID=UPI00082EA43D|nr:hydroxyethylthiazole kinase [Pseudovibrio hongkongensis]